MDIFTEHIVKHKKGTREYLISAGAVLAAFILSFALLMFGGVLFNLGIGFLILVGFFYGAYIVIKYTNVEYEYILTNNELDVDKIMARSRRKRMITVDFRNIDICAPIDDPNYKYEYENTSVSQVYDFSGQGLNKTYFILTDGDSGRIKIIFEPTEKILDGAQKFNPRKVIK